MNFKFNEQLYAPKLLTFFMSSLEYSKYGLPDCSTRLMQRLRSYAIPVIKLPIVIPDIVANRNANFLFIFTTIDTRTQHTISSSQPINFPFKLTKSYSI